MQTEPFHVCGSCKHVWATWQEFVLDRETPLLGFQAVPSRSDLNLILFTHSCKTTVAVRTAVLRPLVMGEEQNGPLASLYGSDECNGHCRYIEELAACDRRCVNARDRELTLRVRQIKQTGRLSAASR